MFCPHVGCHARVNFFSSLFVSLLNFGLPPSFGLTLTLMIFALILTWSFGFYQNHLVYYCMHFGSKPIPSLISRTPKKRNLFSESMGKHKKFGSVTSNSCIHIITSWRELWACRYCFLIFVQLFQIVQDILTWTPQSWRKLAIPHSKIESQKGTNWTFFIDGCQN